MTNRNYTGLGRFIRDRMEAVGIMSRGELSKMTGLSAARVSYILHHEVRLHSKSRDALAVALDVTTDDIMALTKKKPKSPGPPKGKRPATSTTICWKCRNAVPDAHYRCPWSDEGKAIDGWVAKKDEMRDGTNSWTVIKCPEFIPDDEAPELSADDIQTDAALHLASRIVEDTANEYKACCAAEKKNLRRYNEKARILSKFYGGAEPDDRNWRKKNRPEPWARWMLAEYAGDEPLAMKGCEAFFKSEYAEMISPADPVVIMEKIRARYGLPKIEAEGRKR